MRMGSIHCDDIWSYVMEIDDMWLHYDLPLYLARKFDLNTGHGVPIADIYLGGAGALWRYQKNIKKTLCGIWGIPRCINHPRIFRDWFYLVPRKPIRKPHLWCLQPIHQPIATPPAALDRQPRAPLARQRRPRHPRRPSPEAKSKPGWWVETWKWGTIIFSKC